MQKLLWVDIETTGLDPANGHILEIGAIVTDTNLNELDGIKILLKPEPLDRLMGLCNDFVRKMHTDNGLFQALDGDVLNLGYSDAQIVIQNFIKKHFDDKDRPALHGNTVHFDKKWMEHHMSGLVSLWNYRIVDVSSIKVTLQNYTNFCSFEDELKRFGNQGTKHRVMSDIRSSIFEYGLYLKYFGLL